MGMPALTTSLRTCGASPPAFRKLLLGMHNIKELFKSPLVVLINLYHFRHILHQMVLREVKGRFAGSIGGLFWHFIHPILMVLIYLFIFVAIFKLRVGTGGGTGASAIYLMAGIFPWMRFAFSIIADVPRENPSARIIQGKMPAIR